MNYIRQQDLKKLRESTYMGVHTFSIVTGMSTSTIQNIEKCKDVSTKTIKKYLELLSELKNKKYAIIIN